ncbi:MAG: YraN family protein [Chitinophagaceae bacterium]|nr:YraN family protein [Chitinophagaceae bacterium]
MAQHNETGNRGEEIAGAHLTQHGYSIIQTNFRHGRNEVDIIASKGETLHFIEVKTKAGESIGHPEQRVDRSKINRMKIVAEQYLFDHPDWKFIQFDIISVLMKDGMPPEIFVIEDVY